MSIPTPLDESRLLEATPSAILFPELIDIVIDMAASESREVCQTLCLVSMSSRRIALRHLFRTVIIKDQANLLAMCHAISGYRPMVSAFVDLKIVVHNIWMDHVQVATGFISLYKQCENLRNLAIHYSTFGQLIRDTDTIRRQLLRRSDHRLPIPDLSLLLITDPWSTQVTFSKFLCSTSPIVHQITHLQFTWTPHYLSMHFRELSRLTHLALPCYARVCPISRIDHLLRKNPSIEMVVVIFYIDRLEEEDWRLREAELKTLRKRDERVYGFAFNFSDIEKEWHQGNNGGATIWENAVAYSKGWTVSPIS